MGIAVEAYVEGGALDKISRLLDSAAATAPRMMAKVVKSTAIGICKSLKVETKVAPRRMKKREYIAAVATTPPKYLTYRNHKKLPRPLHRWSFTRHVGTPNIRTDLVYVYAQKHATKRGKIVTDKAAERRELLLGTLQKRGKIIISEQRRGLARKSWGWVAKQISTSASVGDLSWHRRKGDKRDPREAVRGLFSASVAGATSTATAEINNHLDYAGAALKPNGLESALSKAAKSLEWKCDEYWKQFSQRMELGSEELMTTPTFLDEEFYKGMR